MENLNVKLESANGTLTVLTGKALEQQAPVKINLTGNILSVAEFLSKRYATREGKSLQAVDHDRALIIVDDSDMSIKLLLDPENVYGTQVTGKLEFTPELLQFAINENRLFTREELVKIIRFNRRFFDAGFHENLLNAYLKLQLSGTTDLKSESDNRGNREAAFKKTINSQNIPTEFVLNIPIFKGYTEERFRVEICLEATDASVRFWFESVELVELIEKRKEEIFNQQLEKAQDFVIIHK